ncbi:MAG: RluA family pseudouridine synthase, partial [Verrucomicrobia bacterium]|nr:RluA family pseudouridine synthase [Verrucomicrobiota bacterium]
MQTTFTVPAGERRPRADKLLAAAFTDHSRVAFHRAFDAGLVTRNGAVIGRDAAMNEGDVIVFSF